MVLRIAGPKTNGKVLRTLFTSKANTVEKPDTNERNDWIGYIYIVIRHESVPKSILKRTAERENHVGRSRKIEDIIVINI